MPIGQDQVLKQVEDALVQSAGYAREAVLRNYRYADYLDDSQEVRRVDLAAFAEMPPSYRSACVAVARFNQDQASQQCLADLRALGARLVVALGPRQASLWDMDSGIPKKMEDLPVSQVGRLIHTKAADWSPAAILRAGEVKAPEPYQFDFGDLGLIPLIESQVNEKLDRVIREVLAGCIQQDPLFESGRQFSKLIRVVFWLLAAKVLADKEHPGLETKPVTGIQALEVAQRHYGDKPPLVEQSVTDWAWERIQQGFHFQNLSVDALAFVYENTLVSPEVRQQLGIHGTPRAIAELVVALLSLEDLPHDQNVILEPCAGFGPFLLAALRRLRSGELLGLDPQERHQHLVRRLRGIEVDAFAIEVGRLCLTLADYPNPDGWDLRNEDVFAAGVLEKAHAQVGVVVANPPFEAFSQVERDQYDPVRAEKAAELLRYVLERGAPLQLGMILPRVIVEGPRSGYGDIRAILRRDYREIDIIFLPDNIFDYSDAETVLLVARSRRRGQEVAVRTCRVETHQSEELLRGHWSPTWMTARSKVDGGGAPFRHDDLAEVWERLEHLPRLGKVAKIHQGLQFKRPLGRYRAELISTQLQPGMTAGVSSAQDVEPYKIVQTMFLNTKKEESRTGGNNPWERPKVIVNANRRRRGKWCLAAVPDSTGMCFYQTYHGVWPYDTQEWPVELLAAVLNGPVAAAIVAARADKRHIRTSVLEEVPLPDRQRLDAAAIVALVQQAGENLDSEVALRIDAEILRGYDLPPRLERRLLRSFEGEDRPGLPDFSGYYPEGFESALPLHSVLSDLTDSHRASRLLSVVPVFEDSRVSEMFEQLATGYGE